ncbi:MAG: serine/threonine protein kinase [Gemmatimonadaceae bacterium]|nr:serine/threonine protein kinase [Gemmatimonadaceae bacterium]
MTSPGERWSRIDALFAEALSLPAAERSAFIQQATAGDARVRDEVIALLGSLTDAADAIGESAEAMLDVSGPLVEAPDAALAVGARVGGYVVTRLLGRGGMGNVYAATQVDGTVDREVAVKVVRRSVAGSSLAPRFARERRILAALEHPHIARLYDGGALEDGTPFLVMELVKGQRIDAYCAARRLGRDAILAMFDAVLDAVAFAHQRLVVHRDIKPANILVTDDGRPMLLDFGLARLVADTEHEAIGVAAPFTRPGQLLMTPEYASPEQVRGEGASVAMDIYALGVVLHELLTGIRPPWQRSVLGHADVAAIESMMVPPSRSVAQARGDGASVAVDAKALRGDLDRVLLRALAPDARERYASVEALREDLRLLRAGYPIRSRRASWWERAGKASRRNPRLVAATATLALVTGVAATNFVVQSATVVAERDRATAERDRALATSRVLSTMFESVDPLQPGRGDTLRVTQMLAAGVQRADRDLASQPAARAELLRAIARAYMGLGRFDDAQQLLDTARAIQLRTPETPANEVASTLTSIGHLALMRGRVDSAEAAHRAALTIRDAAVAPRVASAAAATTSATTTRTTAPAVASTTSMANALANVGASHMAAARFDSARVYIDSALVVLRSMSVPDTGALTDLLNNRATLAMRTNDVSMAARLLGEALAIDSTRLGADHAKVAGHLGNLGFLLDRTGRSAEAEPLLRRALRTLEPQLGAAHPMVRSVQLNLGGALSRLGRLDDAERMIASVAAIERTLGATARPGLPITLDNHAGVLEKLGRSREAAAVYREAFEVSRTAQGEESIGSALLRARATEIECRLDGATAERLAAFSVSRRTLRALVPSSHPSALSVDALHARCAQRAGRVAEAESLFIAVFDVARRNPAQLGPMARETGRELLSLYSAPADERRRAMVQAQLDSLVTPGAPRPR